MDLYKMANYRWKRFLTKPKLVLREDFYNRDERYSELYSRVIRNYFPTTENFLRKVEKVLNSAEVHPPSDQNIDSLEYQQCAYMLRFAVFDSSLSQQRFYESAIKDEKIVLRLSCEQEINICCLGSHSIFSVVGLCKVIEESVKQLGFQDDSMLVRIFVIDKNSEWKSLIKQIVHTASEEFPVIKLILNYVEGDFEKNFSNHVKTAIRKSHLVTNILRVTDTPEAKTSPKAIKNILTNMKKNAILFNVFHNNEKGLTYLDDIIWKNDSFRNIYCSRVPKKYILGERTKLLLPDLHRSVSPFDPLWMREVTSVMFSTYTKRPHFYVKGEEKQAVKSRDFKRKRTVSMGSDGSYKAKKSSNILRNSDKFFILRGKFARLDMEKKNKEDSNRHIAKDVAVSRYANFDDWYTNY